MNHDYAHDGSQPKSFWRSRCAIRLLVVSAIAAYFLLSEHRAHFFGALPFLLLLACPLMHFFMHHGHGGQAGHHGGDPGSNPSTATKAITTGKKP